MAANRKLPFGYTMRMGKVCINEQEAGLVRKIFSDYAGGASYRQLTEKLNAQPVPYNEPGKSWNKNMVARMLIDDRYTGTGTFARLIEPDLYCKVQEILPGKPPPPKKSPAVSTIQAMALCGV